MKDAGDAPLYFRHSALAATAMLVFAALFAVAARDPGSLVLVAILGAVVALAVAVSWSPLWLEYDDSDIQKWYASSGYPTRSDRGIFSDTRL